MVNDNPCKLGSAVHEIVSTLESSGKLSVDRICTLSKYIVSSICDRELPDSETMFGTFFAIKLPDILCMPSSAMSSAVLVAMAMSPEKVEHVERAYASPEFWMVLVPLQPATERSVEAFLMLAPSYTHQLLGLRWPAPARCI